MVGLLNYFQAILQKDFPQNVMIYKYVSFHSKTADSDTVSTYQVSSVQLVTDKKLEAFNKA